MRLQLLQVRKLMQQRWLWLRLGATSRMLQTASKLASHLSSLGLVLWHRSTVHHLGGKWSVRCSGRGCCGSRHTGHHSSGHAPCYIRRHHAVSSRWKLYASCLSQGHDYSATEKSKLTDSSRLLSTGRVGVGIVALLHVLRLHLGCRISLQKSTKLRSIFRSLRI